MNNNRIGRGVITALEHHRLELKELWFSGLKCVFKTTDGQEHWFLYSQNSASELDIAKAVGAIFISHENDNSENLE